MALEQIPSALRPERTVEGEEKAGSLKPVIDALPESVYENPTWKGLAYFGRDLVMYLGLLAVLVIVHNVFAVIGLTVLISLVVSGIFITGHDAAHNALFKSKKLNSFIGHVSMLPGWHVYEGWVLGHNRIHHAFTVRQGYDFVWHPVTPEEYAAMGTAQRLIHRFEWSWLGAGAYYIHQVWWKKMVVGKPPARWAKSIRQDRFLVLFVTLGLALIVGFLGSFQHLSILGYVWLESRTILLPFLGFSYIVGSFVYVQHVHETIRWWKKSEWTKWKGQMEGTTVLVAPPGLNFFIHWIMVHVPHHVDMRVPMYNLEAAADAIEAAFPGTVHRDKLRFRDYIATSRKCKLYDFEAGRWLTYRQGEELLTSDGEKAHMTQAV